MHDSRAFPLWSEYRGYLNKMAAQPICDSWSTILFPRTLEYALYWGNWIRMRYGDVVSAVSRGVAYFLNGVDLNTKGQDVDAREHYTDQLIQKHKINNQLLDVALNLEFYGNAFTTVIPPITRVLKCPHCNQTRYLKSLVRGVDYDFTGGEFITTCSCGRNIKAVVIDYPDTQCDRPLNVVHWNPLSLSIDHCALTGAERIVYYPTAKDKAFVEDEASSTSLESLPKVLLDTLAGDRALKFEQNACLHLSMPVDCISSDEMRGWGLPPFLPAFKYVIMLMLLERQTEAAVKDFILPIRLLFPDPGSSKSGSDPVTGTNLLHMGNLRASIERALKAQAYQQSSWQMVPAPVGQLTLGGDGKAIVPVEVLQFVKSQLLDVLGVPLELYNSSLGQAQGAANAMRIFEQTRAQRVLLYEDYLNWYLKRCTEYLAWPEMTGALVKPSTTTSPERMQALMMLFQQQAISVHTFAREMGLNPDQERLRIREEQVTAAKEQRIIQQQIMQSDAMYGIQVLPGQMGLENALGQEQAQLQGGQGGGEGQPPPEGGAPAPSPFPGQGADPITQISNLKSMAAPEAATPEPRDADADVVASILLHTPIGAPRKQIYQLVKSRNATLYDIAKSKLSYLEDQARQQGVEQTRQGQ